MKIKILSLKKGVLFFCLSILLNLSLMSFVLAEDYDISALDFNTLKTKPHPYIFFTSADVADLQSRWNVPSTTTPQFFIKNEILSLANSDINTLFENMPFGLNHLSLGYGRGIGFRAQNYAFAYLMEGNTATTTGICPYADCTYLNLAKQALLAMDKNPHFFNGLSNSGFLDSSKGLISYALAYDIIEPTLTSEEKEQIQYNIAQEIIRTYTGFNYDVPDKDWTDGLNVVTARAQGVAAVGFAAISIADYTNPLVSGCRKVDGLQNWPVCNGPIFLDTNPNPDYDYNWSNYNSDFFFDWSMRNLFGISENANGDKFWYYTFSRDGIGQGGTGYEQWPLSTGLPLFMALGKNFPNNKPLDNPTIYSIWEKFAYTSDNVVYLDDAAYVGGQIPYNKAARAGLPSQVFPFVPLLPISTLKNDMFYWWKEKFDNSKSHFVDYHTVAGFVNFDESIANGWSGITVPTVLDFYAPEGGVAVMKSGYDSDDSFVWIDGDHQRMNSNQEGQNQGEFIFESRGELLLFTHGRVVAPGSLLNEDWWNNPFPDPEYIIFNKPRPILERMGWWTLSSAQHNIYLIDGYGQRMDIITTPFSAFEDRPDPAYLRQMLTTDNFGYVESDMYYGTVTAIDDNISINRNFLFPNRDYLIVIDRIDGNKQHNYTNQLHIGEPKATIAEVGTLDVSSNRFTLQTPRNLNFYGYFIAPDDLAMDFIDTPFTIYNGGADSNYRHYHLRSTINETTDTDFINILIPRYTTEDQPTVTTLAATGGKAGQIETGVGKTAATEIVTLKEADEVSAGKVTTDAEISFMRDSKPFEYFFIKNGSYYTYNDITYFNSSENLIATLKFTTKNITGAVNTLSGDNVNSADIQIYTEKVPLEVYLDNSQIPFTYGDNYTNISLNEFGDLKLLLEISPCIIQSVRWSRDTATEGEPVNIIVNTKDCNGVKVDLTYEEEDNASDVDPSNDAIDVDLLNLPRNITISGGDETYTWTTQWIEDTDSDDKDPEYVVTAKANNTEISKILKVNKLKYKLMNISLGLGWNLVNIPLVIDNPTIDYVFREISDKITVVSAFDPIDGWLIHHFNPSIPSHDFNITADRAYKIKAKENTVLVVNGTDSTLPRILETGWHLIGLKQTDEVSFKDFFALYADKIEVGWKLTDGTYEQIDIEGNEMMKPVKGYWLLVNETITI